MHGKGAPAAVAAFLGLSSLPTVHGHEIWHAAAVCATGLDLRLPYRCRTALTAATSCSVTVREGSRAGSGDLVMVVWFTVPSVGRQAPETRSGPRRVLAPGLRS